MARVNVYLPDRLAEAVRAAGINLSNVTQVAAERELLRSDVSSWLHRVLVEQTAEVSHRDALAALREECP